MPKPVADPRLTSEAVARRFLILRQVVVYAMMTLPRPIIEGLQAASKASELEKLQSGASTMQQKICAFLCHHGLWDYLSPSEDKLFKATPLTLTRQQHVNASWRLEAAQVLMWSLGMREAMPPYGTRAAKEILKGLAPNPAEFIQTARLRAQSEIERARATAEFWHWRSRTRQLIERGEKLPDSDKFREAGFNSFDDIVRASAKKGAADGILPPCVDEDFAVGGKAFRDLTDKEWAQVRSMTAERHFALNWLCGYAPGNRWDETPTGT